MSASSKKPLLIGVGLAIVVVAGLGLWWFQPHKLFIDDKVDEALPTMAAGVAGPGANSGSATPAAPAVVVEGEVIGLGHTSSGRAMVVELPDGSRLLRFEDFKTDNGPDLRVYLSSAPADGPAGDHDEDFVDLGGLKGNVGNQNYELPEGTDLAKYRTAVVWCRRFSVGFAAAALT